MGLGSFLGRVASSISSAVSSAWSSAKEIAGKAVSWMADKAESFVGKVKDIWEKVKPIVKNVIRPALQKAADLAGTFLPNFPWLVTAIKSLDKGLEYLVEWDKSELAQRISKAIDWAIKWAKNLKNLVLSPEELEEAQLHEQALKEGRSALRGDAAKAIDLATLINSYVQLSTRINDILENVVIKDFEHYLRLRASQKLLSDAEVRLTDATNVDDIEDDDLFLVEIASELLKKQPVLSDSETERLNDIIKAKFNKKLIPFVFEEMIMAWGFTLEGMESEWKGKSDLISKDQLLLKKLQISQRLGDLRSDELDVLESLNKTIPLELAEIEKKRKRTNEMRNYVFAAEGFLQMLEKEPEDFIDKEYLFEDSATAGMIIIECAQFGKKWEELNKEEQMLIIDFANIFEKASRSRVKELVEVAV